MTSRLKIFYSALFLTTLLPYIPFVMPFIPEEIFGLKLTGWAWMMMLIVTVLNLSATRTMNFPVWFWLPWILYLIIYLIIKFSFLGLQLTLQYTLPLFIGIAAGGMKYNEENLEWMFRWFIRLITIIYLMFIYGYLFKGGYGPSAASTSMLFTVPVSLLMALFFIKREIKYLIFAGIIFLAAVLQVARMGIIATAVIFVLHFANQGIKNRLIFGTIGALIFILIFASKPFQEKTFYSGRGTLSDLTVNYYDDPNIKSSGRISYKKALEPGLKSAPVWGNGPRADNAYLIKISRTRGGEAHNDYLSVRFNYGYVGLSLLLLGFAGTFISIYLSYRRYMEEFHILMISTSTLTLFFSFLMFMFTDNILKYTIFFPNYFFALIGIIYNLKKDEDLRSDTSLQ